MDYIDQRKYTLNILYFPVFFVLFNMSLIWIINIPFMKSKGLSFFEIMCFYSFIRILGILFEIPTGVFADRNGYRKSLILSCITKSTALVLMIHCDYLLFRFLSIILFALSDAFFSGSDMAFLYKSLSLLQRESDFKFIFRKSKGLSMLSLACVSLISGKLYELNKYSPFIFTVILVLISMILAIRFYEDEMLISSSINMQSNNLEKHSHIYTNVFRMKFLIIIFALFNYVFSNMNFIAQEVMDFNKLSYATFGFVFFITNLVSAILFQFGSIIEKFFKKNVLIFSALLLSVCFLGIFIFRDYKIALVFLPLMRVSSATVLPILHTEINDRIECEERATVLSIISALVGGSELIVDPIIGFFIDIRGIYFVVFLFIGFTLFLSVLLFFKKGCNLF